MMTTQTPQNNRNGMLRPLTYGCMKSIQLVVTPFINPLAPPRRVCETQHNSGHLYSTCLACSGIFYESFSVPIVVGTTTTIYDLCYRISRSFVWATRCGNPPAAGRSRRVRSCYRQRQTRYSARERERLLSVDVRVCFV